MSKSTIYTLEREPVSYELEIHYTYHPYQPARGPSYASGDYSLNQAKIILGHSLKKICNGAPHYPAKYIHERANEA